MSEVIRLDDRRAEHARRSESRMHSALMHPSLRWVVGGDDSVAHRRDYAGSGTVCGASGSQTLAPTGVALCPGCYPLVTPRSSA